jgi:hypothetical protein
MPAARRMGRYNQVSMFRGPTIIALRARRMAYRIAAEILYPDLIAPPSPQPPAPGCSRVRYSPPVNRSLSQAQIQEVIEEHEKRRRENERRHDVMRLLLALGMATFIIIFAAMAHLLPK